MMTQFPVLGVGALIEQNHQVLLVRRTKPPSQDLWALPGGKVRFGESIKAAAEREIFEETGLTILAGERIYWFELIDMPRFHYVVIDVRARIMGGILTPGDDVREAQWFCRDRIETECIDPHTLDCLRTVCGF